MFSFPTRGGSPPLSLSLSLALTRARAHTPRSHTHTHTASPAHTHTHTRTHGQSLSAALCSSQEMNGEQQGTVVPSAYGSHDALNVGWAGGWRLPRREPGSSVGGASPGPHRIAPGPSQGVARRRFSSLAARSSGNRRGAGDRVGKGWGRVGVSWGAGGENTKPQTKSSGSSSPETKAPPLRASPRGGAEGGAAARGRARSAGAKSLYCHKMGPPSRSARIRRRALSVMVEIPCGKLTPPRSQR